MQVTQNRKNKVNLEDYHYHQDIQDRLFFAGLSTLEMSALEEILNSSLKIPLPILVNNCEQEEAELSAFLIRLSDMGLLTLEGAMVHVNKERRKQVEAQLSKFEEDFEPGMDYLQTLLRKVPIHVLPTWYSLSRACDNIFESIVEKYLQTPRTYYKYLSELTFDEDITYRIAEEVTQAPDFQISSQELRKRYDLTPEEFQRHLLILEFNFVCCAAYRPRHEGWEEYVTLFSEWRHYLSRRQKRHPRRLMEEDAIKLFRKEPFAYIQDMSCLVEIASHAPIPLVKGRKGFTLAESTVRSLLSQDLITHSGAESESWSYAEYFEGIIDKLDRLKLTAIHEESLVANSETAQWLSMTTQEKAQHLYPATKHCLLKYFEQSFSERDFLSLEKWLVRYIEAGWVTFDQFLGTLEVPVGQAQPVTLSQTSRRRWAYHPPQYNDEERAFVRAMIFRRFFELGITQTGKVHGQDCFCLTPYGEEYLRRSYVEHPNTSLMD